MPEQLVDDDDYGDTIMSSETEFGVDETRINADPQPITETLSSPFKKPKVVNEILLIVFFWIHRFVGFTDFSFIELEI